MKKFKEALPHSKIDEVFNDVFFVTGTMKNEFFGSMWQFSRNMTVVREDGKLTLFNTVRLDDDGLKKLEELGEVTHVVRLGDMHGVDDPFYVDRYDATFWALPGMELQDGLKARELKEGGPMPVSDASFFEFKTVKRPEGILRLDREGGIMIACDSLQNWVAPDEFFDDETVATMEKLQFFQAANLGPAWMMESQPQAADFKRLKEIPFKHAFCGHGIPLLETAQEQYHATFDRIINS